MDLGAAGGPLEVARRNQLLGAEIAARVTATILLAPSELSLCSGVMPLIAGPHLLCVIVVQAICDHGRRAQLDVFRPWFTGNRGGLPSSTPKQSAAAIRLIPPTASSL